MLQKLFQNESELARRQNFYLPQQKVLGLEKFWRKDGPSAPIAEGGHLGFVPETDTQ